MGRVSVFLCLRCEAKSRLKNRSQPSRRRLCVLQRVYRLMSYSLSMSGDRCQSASQAGALEVYYSGMKFLVCSASPHIAKGVAHYDIAR